jgi:hypothetical protein
MTVEKCEMPFNNNNVTDYNPLHNSVGKVPEKKIKNYIERISYNKFLFEDTNGNKKVCFKKYITLVDYVIYLIGKYKPEEIEQLPSSTLENKTKFETYINSQHNYAYVDGYFYYLTSKLLEHGFVHGLDYYDNYVCITNNCEINIADDFEYLADSNFFNENLNKLFKFKEDTFAQMFKKNVSVSISEENVPIIAEELHDLDDLDNSENKKIEEQVNIEFEDLKLSDEDSIPDSDHSTVDLSDDEPDLDISNELNSDSSSDEWDTEDDEETEDFENELNEITLVINKIPTQVIAIECCDTTFDSILEENEIRIEELESAMFQVIAMLYLYQQVFKFTHNDLHTNNIMCIHTKEEFLYYKILGKYYKIPTYGRIYKIIDFGRSIYTVNNTLLCSDSFSENGTANTQYNCEPFYNPLKPIIEPNYSFDLCRLACSMVDFIVEDMRDINQYRKTVPVYDLIISWLYDDNGVNILYKKNGEERYPDFKLYKMIARIVHNHTPEKQFDHVCFKKYETNLENMDSTKCMDLELIKSQVHL